MSESGYNGWTNRATWAVALHINNDEGWQSSIQELVHSVIDCPECGEVTTRTVDPNVPIVHVESGNARCEPTEPGETSAEWTLGDVAEAIRDNVTALVDPDAYIEAFGDVPLSQWIAGPGLAARDIGDLDEVDWSEIAESFIAGIG